MFFFHHLALDNVVIANAFIDLHYALFFDRRTNLFLASYCHNYAVQQIIAQIDGANYRCKLSGRKERQDHNFGCSLLHGK